MLLSLLIACQSSAKNAAEEFFSSAVGSCVEADFVGGLEPNLNEPTDNPRPGVAGFNFKNVSTLPGVDITGGLAMEISEKEEAVYSTDGALEITGSNFSKNVNEVGDGYVLEDSQWCSSGDYFGKFKGSILTTNFEVIRVYLSLSEISYDKSDACRKEAYADENYDKHMTVAGWNKATLFFQADDDDELTQVASAALCRSY